MADPTFSILVPALDERENLPDLIAEIGHAGLPAPFEVIVVDDGSTDGTAEALAALGPGYPFLRLVRHERPAGKSAAIRTGARHARGAILITIDGDGQNDPRFLAPLAAPLLEDEAVALVAGERSVRSDGPVKRLASRIANGVRRALLSDDTRDAACGLKAVRREVYLALPFFDNNHRFLPALVRREGYRIAHVPVENRPRRHGRSKYGILDRALVGLPDLLGVWWLVRRRRAVERATEIDLR